MPQPLSKIAQDLAIYKKNQVSKIPKNVKVVIKSDADVLSFGL